MASSRRTLVLFLALSTGHLLLMSVQVQARSGMPLIQAAAFGVFASVQQATAALSDAVRSIWVQYVSLRGVAAENEALRQQVLALQGQVQAEAAIAGQTRELERLLNLQESLVPPTLAARVIAGDAAPGALTITIDRGTEDGVEPDMPVIGHDGVIGRVISQPTAHAAQIQLIIGHNAGIGAMTEQSRAVGPVRGGAGNPPLSMDYVDVLSDVKVGERVLTSGLDGIFPRGYVIGTVVRAVKGSGNYSDIAIQPAVDFSNIQYVLVIVSRPPGRDGS